MLDFPRGSIESITIKNSETTAESHDAKIGRMDVNIKVDNRNINIEMQVGETPFYKERAVFYWSFLYNDLKAGNDYGMIPDAIGIHILDYNLFDCENYQSTFTFMERERHEVLTDRCSIHFFELPKVVGKDKSRKRKELWLELIKADSDDNVETFSGKGDDVMDKAVKVIRGLQGDEKLREEARIRRKWRNDYINDIYGSRRLGRQEGIAEGIAKGRAEGKAEGRAEIVEKMRKLGVPESIIKQALEE